MTLSRWVCGTIGLISREWLIGHFRIENSCLSTHFYTASPFFRKFSSTRRLILCPVRFSNMILTFLVLCYILFQSTYFHSLRLNSIAETEIGVFQASVFLVRLLSFSVYSNFEFLLNPSSPICILSIIYFSRLLHVANSRPTLFKSLRPHFEIPSEV